MSYGVRTTSSMSRNVFHSCALSLHPRSGYSTMRDALDLIASSNTFKRFVVKKMGELWRSNTFNNAPTSALEKTLCSLLLARKTSASSIRTIQPHISAISRYVLRRGSTDDASTPKSEIAMEKTGRRRSLPTASTVKVFPVPGFPCRMTTMPFPLVETISTEDAAGWLRRWLIVTMRCWKRCWRISGRHRRNFTSICARTCWPAM